MNCDESCFEMSREEHESKHYIDNLARAAGFKSVLEWAYDHKAKLEEDWERKLFEGEVLLWGYDAAWKNKKKREEENKF